MIAFFQHALSVQTVAFTVLGYPMSYIELVGTVFNLWCVWLVAKNKVLNWPVGLVGVVAFAIMFWQIQLYSDLVEQFYFFVTGIWGWYLWTHNPNKEKAQRPISSAGLGLFSVYVVAITVLTIVLAEVTINLNAWFPTLFPQPASYPYIDAITTIMSFAATIMMCYRQIECWYLWIAVDIIDVPLYWVKDVHFVSLLYFVFLCICIRGVVGWLKEYRTSLAKT